MRKYFETEKARNAWIKEKIGKGLRISKGKYSLEGAEKSVYWAHAWKLYNDPSLQREKKVKKRITALERDVRQLKKQIKKLS